jgi:hypothetical protein
MMRAMQDSLITVVFVVAILAGAVAIYLLIASGRVFGQVGGNGLDARDVVAGGDMDGPGEREQDIREMLEARNVHRERRGEETQDLDEELAELLHPPVDEGLREEMRELVVARNHRRERNGLEPLDVEVEIERRLRELN